MSVEVERTLIQAPAHIRNVVGDRPGRGRAPADRRRVHEGPPEILLRVLRRGDVLGELALLREGVRAASARAQRDTELIELGRVEFEHLIEQAPEFALGLTRVMGAQNAASRSPVVPSIPPRTIAVVGLDPHSPVAEVAEALAEALSVYGPTARLRSGDLATIDQAERDTGRVVLIAPADPVTITNDEATRSKEEREPPEEVQWSINAAAGRQCNQWALSTEYRIRRRSRHALEIVAGPDDFH